MFQIPMGELVKELQTIRDSAAEWDPDGQIEWDITAFIISLESGFQWEYGDKYCFTNKQKAIDLRNHINSKFEGVDPAKVLKVKVNLNKKD